MDNGSEQLRIDGLDMRDADWAAEVLGVSEVTAKRDWAFARAWLYQRTGGAKPPDST